MNTNFKNIVAGLTVIISLFSCKKSETLTEGSNGQSLETVNVSYAVATQKALFVIDDIHTKPNFPKQAIYVVKKINSNPIKVKLFEGEENFVITDITKGAKSGEAYFIYQNHYGTSDKEGIYRINANGGLPVQILKENSGVIGDGISDIEYDPIKNKIYWETSFGISIDGDLANSIHRCNTDGSLKGDVVPAPYTAQVGGNFTISGNTNTVFYSGSSGFDQNDEPALHILSQSTEVIDADIAKKLTNINVINNSYKIKLDAANNRLLLCLYNRPDQWGNILGSFGDVYSLNTNQLNQSLTAVINKDNNNRYSERTFDLTTSTTYFSKAIGLAKRTTLFSSDLNGANVKTIIGGFSNILRGEITEAF